MPETFICREPNGRHVRRTAAEIVALNRPYYDTVARQWKTGDPSASGSNALTGHRRRWGGAISIPPPSPPAINWQSVPSYDLGSGDKYINGGYFRNETRGPAFGTGFNSTGTLILENAVIETRGSLFAGFKGKWRAKNLLVRMLPNDQTNAPDFRAINAQELRNGVLENCTIIGGGGCFASGFNGSFNGDINAGEGLVSRFNRYVNILGQRREADGSLRRSNWSDLHANHPGFQATAGATIGWDVRQFWQLSRMTRARIVIDWNEVLNELGKSHHEDLISLLYGSGGTPELIAQIRNNLLVTSGGLDYPRLGTAFTSYDPSNQVTTGTTSPQIPADTRNSQTAIIIGDQARDLYADNVHDVNVEGNVALGARGFIKLDIGRSVTFKGNRVLETDRHPDGTLYSGYHEAYFEVRSGTHTTQDGQNAIRDNQYLNNVLAEKGGVAGATLNLPTTNGSTSSGNTYQPAPTDGGVAEIAAYRARAAAAGVTIGSNLPVPAEWNVNPKPF